jgi:hypothetical protein
MHHLRPGRLLCRDQPSFLKRRVAIFKVVSTAPPCVRHHIDPAYHVIALEHLRPFLEWLVFLLTHVPIIEMLKARTGIQRGVCLLRELSLHGALILRCCLF